MAIAKEIYPTSPLGRYIIILPSPVSLCDAKSITPLATQGDEVQKVCWVCVFNTVGKWVCCKTKNKFFNFTGGAC